MENYAKLLAYGYLHAELLIKYECRAIIIELSFKKDEERIKYSEILSIEAIKNPDLITEAIEKLAGKYLPLPKNN